MTEKDQKYSQALIRGAELMMKHGLKDWTVKLHSKRRVLADCGYRSRTIRYSKHFLMIATPEQLEGVTLHEIAHALVGPGHGHDLVFKQKVIEIGGDPNYSHKSVDGIKMPYKYNLECPECGSTSHSNFNKKYICGHCDREGKLVPLTITLNVLEVTPWAL